MTSPAERSVSEASLPLGAHTIRIDATPEGVRDGIRWINELFPEGSVPLDILAGMEIAVAEILNNVVEHAYAGVSDGKVHMVVDVEPTDLLFTIVDDGVPMPTGRLPSGAPADPNRPDFEQEEGGYGLYMIRQIARKLRYRRLGDQNQLTFRVALDKPIHMG